MIKVVCIDLDGTLLTDEKQVSKKTLRLLDNLIARGIEVIVATGRHYFMAKNFLKDLNRDVLICSNNGAMSIFKDSEKILDIEYVDNAEMVRIVDLALEYGLTPYIYVDSSVEGYHLIVNDGVPKRSHFEEDTSKIGISQNTIKYLSEVNYKDINTVLCIGFLDEQEKINKFYKLFEENPKLVKNKYTIPDGRCVVEFQSCNANKWIAVSRYLDKINVKSSEVLSFGDEFNDKEMIANSGVGYAMKNGIEDLKKIADHITEYSNNEDGVYYELKKIFKID